MIDPLESASLRLEDEPEAMLRDIDAIQARIVQAEGEREVWRSAGREDKYLEAYVTVEALVLQLEACYRALSVKRPSA